MITKKNSFTTFRAMLNYAVKMEYIPKNSPRDQYTRDCLTFRTLKN
ncbi:hypothetical protein [Massiliimalia massiliensis]